MTRVKISIAILLLLMGTGIFSGIWADRSCRELSAEAMAVCEALEKGDSQGARDRAEVLCRHWKSFRTKAALLVKFDKLMDTDRIAAHFDPAVSQCGEEIIPHLAEFTYMMYILRRNELPYFTSVF